MCPSRYADTHISNIWSSTVNKEYTASDKPYTACVFRGVCVCVVASVWGMQQDAARQANSKRPTGTAHPSRSAGLMWLIWVKQGYKTGPTSTHEARFMSVFIMLHHTSIHPSFNSVKGAALKAEKPKPLFPHPPPSALLGETDVFPS